VDTVKFT